MAIKSLPDLLIMIKYFINSPIDANAVSNILILNNMGERSPTDLEKAIASSFLTMAAYYDNKLIGCARVISDGVYYAFLCDVAVSPDFQHKGIGIRMIKKILKILEKKKFRMIGLFTSEKNRQFYEKVGFVWQDEIHAMMR